MMKEQLLRSAPVFNRLLAGSLILMVATVGVFVVVASRAATNQMYLSPATLSVDAGNDINISVRVNSGTDPVNAVEADLTYDATKLQYVSTSSAGSDFPLEAITTPTSGSLKLARATSPGSAAVVGDALVAIVTFHTLASSGTSDITVDSSSAVVRSTDNTNILVDSAGATISFGAPSTPTPTPSPTPTATPAPTPSPTPGANDSASLFVAPSSGTIGAGADFSVEIHEDSGTAPVNAVQANFTYPANLLQVTGIDETNSGFGLNASTSSAGGVISIARGTTPGLPAVTGDQNIVTVNFHPLAAGTATLAASADSIVVRASDSSNILANYTGGTYVLAGVSASPTPTPTPASMPTPTPIATPTPQQSPTPVVVHGQSSPPVVSGTVKFKSPSESSNETVAVSVDGSPQATDTVDTTTLNDGEHIVSVTTDTGSIKQTTKQEVTVSNKTSPYQRFIAGLQANGPTLGVAALFIVVVVGAIVLARKLILVNSPASRAIGGHNNQQL